MTIGLSGPCNWPNSGCPACDGADCMTASQRADVEAWAKSDLWEATGRVYGTCEVSVMPCNDWGVLCGSCWNSYRSCGCAFISEVKLPGPVHSIVSVFVDGVELDQADYRVDDWQWLVRLDGGVWPVWGDLTDPTSFLVTYLLGQEPPAGAGSVTGMLVCARSGCSNTNCKVPRNATQVSRQGTTMTLNSGVGTNSRAWRYYPDTVGIFGIPDVDAWVRNANAPIHAGAVHSPDLPTVRQITWEATSP